MRVSVYPMSIPLYVLASHIFWLFICLCWSTYRSVPRLKAILLFDKQNEVTYPNAES